MINKFGYLNTNYRLHFLIQGKSLFCHADWKNQCCIEYLKNPKCECYQRLGLNEIMGEFMSDIYLCFDQME
jgi:hypothetical protein